MSEHIPGDAGWDDPEAADLEDEDELEERAAQGEDPTSPERGFEDLDDLEDFEDEEGEEDEL